jgi:hypothetical protein
MLRGTAWKQMGITLVALPQRPDLLEAVRTERDIPVVVLSPASDG